MIVWLWLGFVAFVLGMLAIDLGVLNRGAKVISTGMALIWSGFCVALALGFTVVVYYLYEYDLGGVASAVGHPKNGQEAALQFLTAWLIEQSLSLDNIFVIAVIFNYFSVPREYQHRTLFYGILGALIFRGIMIAAGVTLIHYFEWVIYIFGAVLIWTGLKMLLAGDEKIEPERNPLVRAARRLYPVSGTFEGERFFTRVDGRRAVTPLFLALLVIESTDILFAVDSIPAVLAITKDLFIVFTSNVFAILNLRSLYFALAGMLEAFRYLKYSLVLILLYVGVKMILSHHLPIPTALSLGLIAASLAGGMLASMFVPRRSPGAATQAAAPDGRPRAEGAGRGP